MFWLVTFLAVLTSVIYFRSSPQDQPLALRVLVSAHGVTIAALFIAAMCIYWSNWSRAAYAKPYAVALLVPLVLIVVSLFAFRGPRSIHWLQLANVFCLAVTLFVGGMAITGDFP
jgi:hypothetical protein